MFIISSNFRPLLLPLSLLPVTAGSDYTYSIIGFVVVLALLLSAITAIFIACICCGHCKSYPLPAQGQRPSTLHSTPHSRTGLGSITSPRQLPTSRSFRSNNNQFPLPNSTTDTSISAHQSSPHTPASVIHLGQLPPLDHALRHGRRRPSLPPLSTAPSHLPHGSRSHFRHYHQLSEGLHNDNPSLELVGGATGGVAAGGCRTPMSAGVLQSAAKFPSPLLLQDKQHKHCHLTGLSNNLDHTHLTPNDVNKSVRLCPHPSDVIQSENAIRPFPEGVVKSKAVRPLPEGVVNGTPARPLPEGVVVSCSPREGNLNGLVPSVQASSTTCV